MSKCSVCTTEECKPQCFGKVTCEYGYRIAELEKVIQAFLDVPIDDALLFTQRYVRWKEQAIEILQKGNSTK